jgi:C_GCAxxG_C_C family probable redox protein
MEIKVKEINLKKVQKDAENNFRGGFFCCEALMAAIRSNFELDVPEEVIAMSSGMAVGIGRSGCCCGAFNGGVLALGMIFGRTVPKGPTDPVVNKVMDMTKELHDWFKVANGKNAICCRVLTREFDMGKGEHKEQCIRFTGLCAWKTAEIICRELGIKMIDEEV